MTLQEIRALSDEQLREELEKARREVFNLRLRAVTRQLANPHEVRNARKKVARVLTLLREREFAAPSPEG